MSYYSLSELLHGSRWGVHGDCWRQGVSRVGKYRAHTGHQAASHTGEMKDFGDEVTFSGTIWREVLLPSLGPSHASHLQFV